MRVLVVEDETRIVAVLRDALESEGISVESAFDGVSGLESALSGTYDLVILDLMLPRRGGVSVLEALTREKPELPVLILSARADLQTKLQGFELGAVDYLTKPFSVEEFLARVKVRLKQTSDFDSVIMRAGDMELDLVRRQVRVNGVVSNLSDREFALLRCLAGSAGTVVTRERLLADVWGFEFDPGTNLLDVCMKRLRQKLGSGSSIETVRNTGYRIPAHAAVIATDVEGSPVRPLRT